MQSQLFPRPSTIESTRALGLVLKEDSCQRVKMTTEQHGCILSFTIISPSPPQNKKLTDEFPSQVKSYI